MFLGSRGKGAFNASSISLETSQKLKVLRMLFICIINIAEISIWLHNPIGTHPKSPPSVTHMLQ
jgi:hypothetical protein